MAPSTARTLRLVDEHGQVTEEACPTCVGFQVTIRSQAGSIGNLKRQLNQALADVDANHDAFPAFKRCHDHWRELCNHPRTEYDLDDFKLFLPLYQKHGEEMCHRAVEGAAYDCFTTTRKNGSVKRHDDFELIFRNGTKFREFANRAPYHLPKPEHVHTLTKALMFLWPLETHEAVDSAQRMLRHG